MRRIAIALSFVALIGVAVAAVDDAKAVKKTITANYEAMSKTFVDKDFKSFSGFMTDDFVTTNTDNSNTMNRDKVVKDFTSMRGQLSDVKWTKKIKKFELDGVNAHVTVDGRITAKLNMGDGKDHPFQVNASSVDDWVKAGDSWLLKASKTLTFEAKLDGKPLKHG
jgi:ketosteroid isomerase-like protein